MQQCADIHLLLNYSTCFRRPSHQSSQVHKAVIAASGTDHTIWEASFLNCDHIRTYLVTFEEACSSVPEAATTILCIPDDGRDGRPKHVE